MNRVVRDIAQLGSAPALGAGCRRFKSCYPDLFIGVVILCNLRRDFIIYINFQDFYENTDIEGLGGKHVRNIF